MKLSLTPFALVLASLSTYVSAQNEQVVFDAIHNATTIVGTWATGSRAVVTGAGFANPSNQSFTYPKVTGVSYSFTDDGWYEIARYRFNSNASEPNCITGVIGWVHGKYSVLSNGSIVMTPNGDGYQQIQDPCAAVSNFIENYNETELYQSWRIFTDPVDGYKLHLFQFDGSPVAPQFQVSTTPNMLPTRQLRNVTTVISKRDNGAESRVLGGWTVLAAGASTLLAVASLL
ncbi:Reversal of tor2 lethality [Stygiomarasmius scandens]|uniref:Protein ROT1 n=1 Tax=Marasmiellus scandens TaxID=2682957 RepID=A0ABR1JTT0_9AGAR